MTRFQPVGNGKRDHNWPAKGRFGGFARLNGDFFNAIDPERTLATVRKPAFTARIIKLECSNSGPSRFQAIS
jgi:hypothetical protein